MSRGGHHGPAGELPPPPIGSTDAPVRRIYTVVDPSALARIYAASLQASATAGVMGSGTQQMNVSTPEVRREVAERDVLAFIELVRRPAGDL